MISVKNTIYEKELSRRILDAAFKVHTALGPGLLENSYKECLYYELNRAGLFVEKEKALPLIYEEVKLDIGYRLDLLVENKVIIELKAVESINEVNLAQVLTYLKLSGKSLGLILNFNMPTMRDGIVRIVNEFKE